VPQDAETFQERCDRLLGPGGCYVSPPRSTVPAGANEMVYPAKVTELKRVSPHAQPAVRVVRAPAAAAAPGA
jgi:hypothetical protein